MLEESLTATYGKLARFHFDLFTGRDEIKSYVLWRGATNTL